MKSSYRGSRAASWVVAASDASEKMRKMADFRCDGVAAGSPAGTPGDDVEIQYAMNALPI